MDYVISPSQFWVNFRFRLLTFVTFLPDWSSTFWFFPRVKQYFIWRSLPTTPRLSMKISVELTPCDPFLTPYRPHVPFRAPRDHNSTTSRYFSDH
jgi:hypothetical protein